MSERQRIVDDLIRDEGIRYKPYLDTVGKWTIGVGRNLSDNGLTHAEVMVLLDHDLDHAITDLANFPWFVGLDAVRQRALVNMRFNLGPTRFRGFKRMIRMLEQGHYAAAAEAARNSLWHKQVKSRGERIVHMLLTGHDL